MERSTLPTVKAGDHWSLRISRQMAPLLLMLQWYMRVRKTTCTVPGMSGLAVPLPHQLQRLAAGMVHTGRQVGTGQMQQQKSLLRGPAQRLDLLDLAGLDHLGRLERVVRREANVQEVEASSIWGACSAGACLSGIPGGSMGG